MTSGWAVVGASVAGTKHQRTGAPCEDSWEVLQTDRFTLCCVADGAGSADQAAVGAQTAVQGARIAANRLGRRLIIPPIDQLANELLVAAARAVERCAIAAERPLRDYNTTLTIGLMNDHHVAVTQVGDCIAVLRASDHYEVIGHPERPGRFVEETEFLSSERAAAALVTTVNIDRTHNPVRLALSTDGLGPLLLKRWNPPTPHDPFFDSLFAALDDQRATNESIRRFMNSADVCDRTDDDKTLLLAQKAAR